MAALRAVDDWKNRGTPTRWSTVQGIRDWLSSLLPADATAEERGEEEREEQEEKEFAARFGWGDAKRQAEHDVGQADPLAARQQQGVLELLVLDRMASNLKDELLRDDWVDRGRFQLVKASAENLGHGAPSQVCPSSVAVPCPLEGGRGIVQEGLTVWVGWGGVGWGGVWGEGMQGMQAPYKEAALLSEQDEIYIMGLLSRIPNPEQGPGESICVSLPIPWCSSPPPQRGFSLTPFHGVQAWMMEAQLASADAAADEDIEAVAPQALAKAAEVEAE